MKARAISFSTPNCFGQKTYKGAICLELKMRSMRIPCIIFAALLMTAGSTWALESDTYSLNPKPAPHSALVSFSIGYPKGWYVSEDPSLQRADVYNDIPVGPQGENVCNFNEPATDVSKNGITMYSIWRSDVVTAKEAADRHIANMAAQSWHTEKSLNPVKTSAGDSGWLVESKGYVITDPAVRKFMTDPTSWKGTNVLQKLTQMEKNVKLSQKVPVIYHDFFFHVETKAPFELKL